MGQKLKNVNDLPQMDMGVNNLGIQLVSNYANIFTIA
jgi:hypothetical protein